MTPEAIPGPAGPVRGRSRARTPSARSGEVKGSAPRASARIVRPGDVLTSWKALAELWRLNRDSSIRLGWISCSSSRVFSPGRVWGASDPSRGPSESRARAEEPACVATLDGAAELLLYLNGRKVIEKNVDPETMLLPYLRKKLQLTGTKYSCGGGGCGACTVRVSRYNPATRKIRHCPANACLIPFCSVYGAAITTVEGIGGTTTRVHPVQERITKCHGTHCGFCNPGMEMSIYTLLKNHPDPTLDQLTDALGGNLCRCTGYRPIIDACKTFSNTSLCCQSKENGVCCLNQGINRLPEFEEGDKTSQKLFSEEEFLPLDPTQELIFPPELNGPEVKFKGAFHPVIISPDRIEELNAMNYAYNGLIFGAGLSLAQVKDILADAILKLPEEKTQTYQALQKHLGTLAVCQIRNMAWEFVSAFCQAHRQQNALTIVNSGMRVFFGERNGITRELSILYGGVGPTTICAKNSCQKLIGRPWNEEMLDAACRLVLDEVSLPGSAPGGKVEFKRTLIVSFLFKFYLEVSQY